MTQPYQQPLPFSLSNIFTFSQKLHINLNFIDILPFFLVALIWGSTDVQIAKCSKQSKQQFNAVDFSPMNLIKFIISKKIWIWIGLNQIGSIIYAYLLGILIILLYFKAYILSNFHSYGRIV